MIAKIVTLALALALISATGAVAGPAASEELDGATEIALTQAAPPLYLPQSEAVFTTLPEDVPDGPSTMDF